MGPRVAGRIGTGDGSVIDLNRAKALKEKLRRAIDPESRRAKRAERSLLAEFLGQQAHLARLPVTPGASERCLFISHSMGAIAPLELLFVNCLRLAGKKPVVLLSRSSTTRQYLAAAGDIEFLYWEDFAAPVDEEPAREMIANVGTFGQYLALTTSDGMKVGKIAASSLLRRLRVGHLDVAHPTVRREASAELARAITWHRSADAIVESAAPDLLVLGDRGYTPNAQIFSLCVNRGIPSITFNAAHKSDTLMVKRYGPLNQDQHPSSLSDRTWKQLRKRGLEPSERAALHDELLISYETGDWHSEVGTQFGRAIQSSSQIRTRFELSGAPVAVIYPHILWDGTFFWGEDLFESYEDWFVQTVLAACKNESVDWLIKIHPAHVVKNNRDGVSGPTAEELALRAHIGTLPSHVKLVPPEDSMNTYSLFSLMDYCLTVRGTIGIEAAMHGVRVLTAGTGRYDGKGFTVDSESASEYLGRLARLQEVPSMSSAESELAETYAYGLFLLRPMVLRTVSYRFQRDSRATPQSSLRIDSGQDWLTAADVAQLSSWLADGTHEDFLQEGE